MHDLGRDLMGFVLSMCWTQELVRPTLDAQIVVSYTAALVFIGFFIMMVAQLILK